MEVRSDYEAYILLRFPTVDFFQARQQLKRTPPLSNSHKLAKDQASRGCPGSTLGFFSKDLETLKVYL